MDALCSDINYSPVSPSIHENSNNDAYDSEKTLDYGKSEEMGNLEEFEEVLNKYREEHTINSPNISYKTNEFSCTQTLINLSLDITETAEKIINSVENEKQNINENCFNNSQKINENGTNNSVENNTIGDNLQNVNTDIISLSSDEAIVIDDSDHTVDLDAISLSSYNNIVLEKNQNKSIEITIDFTKQLAYDENVLNDVVKNKIPLNKDVEVATENNNIEIASENNNLETLDESNSSFHSSDFEFITEDEAKIDGLIINYRNDIQDANNNVINDNYIEMSLPGPSNEYDRETHRIPEGEEFFNLFHGIYAPANVPELIFLENKSVIPSKCMSVDMELPGFGMARLDEDNSFFDEEYQDEAKETAKKIRESYHNGRRLRRRDI